MKTKTKGLLILAALLLALILAVGIYAGDYYHAESAALDALESTETVTVTLSSDQAVFQPREPKAGLIFYPGGKVEFTAYAPLMQALAREDVLCVLLKMPLNLAVLDMDAAEGIRRQYPQVERWYLGGHSLGGSMAASYIADEEGYAGLLLLASYSTADLSDTGLQVLSVYGTEDGVLNSKKYTQYRPNLPETTQELVLYGGNHAQFGNYGFQEGDGQASIPAADQQSLTVEAFAGLLP